MRLHLGPVWVTMVQEGQTQWDTCSQLLKNLLQWHTLTVVPVVFISNILGSLQKPLLDIQRLMKLFEFMRASFYQK